MEVGGVVVVAATAALGYLAYDTYWNGGLEPVKSKIDGRTYQVRSLPDKQKAADLLASIAANLTTLMNHIEKTAGDDERTLRLVKRFHPERISESPESDKFTSYSINKGERVVFCLRQKGTNELVDLNTMMFVAIHEIGHIVTTAVGHPPAFWDNFRWLLDIAINIGIFTDRDYKKDPQEYCGIQITDSPLH